MENRDAGMQGYKDAEEQQSAIRNRQSAIEPSLIFHLAALRDRLVCGIIERIEEVRLNGHPTQRLPNNVHVCIERVDGEAVLLNLDLAGIAASVGSACTSGASEPAHVLKAMGVPPEQARGALRLTLGRDTTEEDINFTVDELAAIVERLRKVRRR